MPAEPPPLPWPAKGGAPPTPRPKLASAPACIIPAPAPAAPAAPGGSTAAAPPRLAGTAPPAAAAPDSDCGAGCDTAAGGAAGGGATAGDAAAAAATAAATADPLPPALPAVAPPLKVPIRLFSCDMVSRPAWDSCILPPDTTDASSNICWRSVPNVAAAPGAAGLAPVCAMAAFITLLLTPGIGIAPPFITFSMFLKAAFEELWNRPIAAVALGSSGATLAVAAAACLAARSC